MKLFKLIILRLKSYFKKPAFIFAFLGFLIVFWAILNFTNSRVSDTLILPIGVIDLDQSEYSKLIVSRVSQKNTIDIKTTDMDEALKQVSVGKLEAVYILQEGLMDSIISGNTENIIEIVKSPVSLSEKIIGELFSAEAMRLSSNVDAARSVSRQYSNLVDDKDKLWSEAWDSTDRYWEPSPLITIDYRSSKIGHDVNPNNTEDSTIVNNVLEILIITLLTFSILVASSSLLTEKNNGTFKRIISTGTPLFIYILSCIITILTIHLIGVFVILLSTGELGLLLTNIASYLLYMIWASILGIIIVTFASSMQQLLILIPFITLCNSLLIWKLQVYNGFGSYKLIFNILAE